MSAVTRFKQSVSHGKGRKPEQPSPAFTWVIPHSELTCTTYICLLSPSALASTLTTLHYALGSPPWPSQIHDLPTLLAASGFNPSQHPAVLSLLEEDRPATTPVIPTQDYPRTHKDSYIFVALTVGSL
ncbi:hypothetical protein E2C01_001813 [Portunus trituberculatus]|uniref:Uncharacterized protein n=1 Tax=Portunus trituberculatus TaxID=210409 RepID=A0A5B7CIJ4_PORTR|nr:hypothetical protein [Portunus trituberculatus]